MNLLDKLVLAVAPSLGLRRARARAAARALDATTRRYDAADHGPRTDGWLVSRSGPDSENSGQLHIIRDRARDLARNSPLAARAADMLSTNMVGDGHTPRIPVTTAADVRTSALDAWRAFVAAPGDDTGTFHAVARAAARAMVVSGEALIVWEDLEIVSPGAPPLRCWLLEADYLDSTKTEPTDDGGYVIQGVELGPDGRRRGYWLYETHPGETLPIAGTYQSAFYPVSRVDHIYAPKRPGESRGVSWFAPVAISLRDRDDYMSALQMHAKISACLAAVVHGAPAGAPGAVPNAARPPLQDSYGQSLDTLAPGMVAYLDPGQQISTVTPPALDGSQTFLTRIDHDIAAGLGLPHATLTGDLSGANYSSLREGKLQFWTQLDVWQSEIIQGRIYAPAWRRVMAANARLRRAPVRWPTPEWARPPRPWVDPVKDVEAVRLEMASLLRSRSEVIAERGGDSAALDQQIADEIKRLAELGITFNPIAATNGAGGDNSSAGGFDANETDLDATDPS